MENKRYLSSSYASFLLRAKEEFFGDLPACNLFKDHVACGKLTEIMGKLLRNSVWLDCCVMSYTPASTDHMTRRMYQLFDTRIKFE